MNSKLYKSKFILAFYDKDDETLIDVVDNVRDICLKRGIEPTRRNINNISKALCIALRSNDCMTEVYDGKQKLHVHLIDDTDDEDDGKE